MAQLQSVTCHMGSHSVTCYPTQVNMQAGIVIGGYFFIVTPNMILIRQQSAPSIW